MADAGQFRQSYRRVWAFGLALLLAACQSTAPVKHAPVAAPPPPTKAAPAAPVSSLPEDRERHRVALLVPLSGPNGGVGQSIANASVLALADTKDRALRVTTYDTGTGAAAAASKAISDGNTLIIGPLLGEDVRAVAPIAKANNVPVLSFSNDTATAGDNVWLLGFQPSQSIDRVVRFAKSKGLTRFAGLIPKGAYGHEAANTLIIGPLLGEDVRAVAPIAKANNVPVLSFSNDTATAGDNVWLLGFQPSQSIDRVVRFAKSKGLSRFAGLIPKGAYGHEAANTLIRAAESAGGSVVSMQNYERSPKAIGAAIASLAKQKYDAVLIADSGRVAVIAAPLIHKTGGAQVRLLGTELWNAEPGLNAASDMTGAWFASVDDSMFQSLSARYKARYGRTPFRLASIGYDAVLLTVRIARDWAPNAPFPVDRLTDSDGFSGVDGAFRFGPNHLAERALAVHQLGPGGGSVVSPAASAF